MDPSDAQKARAERIHRQIDRMIKQPAPETAEPEGPKSGESPRDYVHRRMREIDRERSSNDK
jgi:hypothetical protein